MGLTSRQRSGPGPDRVGGYKGELHRENPSDLVGGIRSQSFRPTRQSLMKMPVRAPACRIGAGRSGVSPGQPPARQAGRATPMSEIMVREHWPAQWQETDLAEYCAGFLTGREGTRWIAFGPRAGCGVVAGRRRRLLVVLRSALQRAWHPAVLARLPGPHQRDDRRGPHALAGCI